MGASSFSPSPITTVPSIETDSSIIRIASTAAPSADSFSPRPIQRAQASAAYSVVRTSSSAKFRSGRRPSLRGSSTWLAVRASMAATLQHARGLLVVLVERLAHVAGDPHAEAGQEGHEVAEVEADLDAGLGLPEDDAVAEDQDERGDADDHRDLARLPGELVAAGDYPGEDERGRAGRDQDPVEEVVDLPGVSGAVRSDVRRVDLRVGVATRREPGQPEGSEKHQRGQHPPELPRAQPRQGEITAPLLHPRGLHRGERYTSGSRRG